MVSYNTRALTLDAIGSIFDSLLDPGFGVEVIVVDNASFDGSADSIEASFPQVRVIRSAENLGFGRGNNLGASHATGDAILLLNTDTVVRPGAIEILYRALHAEPMRGVVGPFLENPDGSYQFSMISFPSVRRAFCNFFWLDRLFPRSAFFADEFMTHADPLIEREVDVIHGASMMIRRDLFESIGGFDSDYFMYYEEVDLCKRAAEHGYRSRYVPSAHVMHLINQSSRSSPPGWYYSVHRKSRMIYARKHMRLSERLAIRLIMHSGYALRIALYHIVGVFRPRFRALGHNMLKSYLDVTSPLAARKNAER
jgi:GT2 family glycosyltransferase